jgi:hypothetical protein
MPDQASDPPHCNATISSDAGQGSRTALSAAGSISITLAMPVSTVFERPATSWMFMVWNAGPRSSP